MHTSLPGRLVTCAVVSLLVLAALPGLAAADSRAGGSIVVAEGETVDGLEAFGGSVVVRGTVDGDLQAFAGDVTIAPSGRVTGDVQTAAGNVRVAGTVGGSLEAAGGQVTIAEGATVGGDLEAGAGVVRIDGRVDGSATVGAETIVLGPSASLGGDLTYDGDLRGNRDAVAGAIVRDTEMGGPAEGAPDLSLVAEWLLGLYGFLVNLVLGALLLVVAPNRARRVADRIREAPIRAGGAGLLALVVTPVLLVLIALTIVGIPFALAGAVLFGLVAWAGGVLGRLAVGAWLLSYTDVRSRWAALGVGFLAVAVAVRVPWVGWLADLAVLLVGVGALVLLANDWRRSRREGPGATATGGAGGA